LELAEVFQSPYCRMHEDRNRRHIPHCNHYYSHHRKGSLQAVELGQNNRNQN